LKENFKDFKENIDGDKITYSKDNLNVSIEFKISKLLEDLSLNDITKFFKNSDLSSAAEDINITFLPQQDFE